ncbi:MAG: peptide-N-glycosidase F-related protein, partial [Myxococcales bacterium]
MVAAAVLATVTASVGCASGKGTGPQPDAATGSTGGRQGTGGSGESGGEPGVTATGGTTGGTTAATGGTTAATGGTTAGGGTAPGGSSAEGTGGSAGTGGGGASAQPGTFKVFDRIPMFGMYATTNPTFTPPAGVLMWTFGTVFVVKLSAAQQAQIGSDLAARITYHAQCDNYDRIGGVFLLLKSRDQTPDVGDERIELVRFITPFSDYNRGALSTYVYPDADLAAYARTLADTSRDVWIGIAGGSNPYDGDPCTNAAVTPDFRNVGYKYSLELVSKQPSVPAAGPAAPLTALSNVAATTVPIIGTLNNTGGGEIAGMVTVIVSGHGSAAGGHEYRYTQDTVTLNGKQIGSFSTQTDCAALERYSPDGNRGIFRDNAGANPRNWCPGALVPAHTFPATLSAGRNTVSLGLNATSVPTGSYYATSI